MLFCQYKPFTCLPFSFPRLRLWFCFHPEIVPPWWHVTTYFSSRFHCGGSRPWGKGGGLKKKLPKRSISLSRPCGPRLSSKTRGAVPLLWIRYCSVSTCAAKWLVWSFFCCVLNSPPENRKHNSGNMKHWSTGHLFLFSTQFSNLTMFFVCFCLNELSEFS